MNYLISELIKIFRFLLVFDFGLDMSLESFVPKKRLRISYFPSNGFFFHFFPTIIICF